MQRIRAKGIAIIITIFAVVIIVNIYTSSGHPTTYTSSQSSVASSTASVLVKLVSFSSSYRRGKYTFNGAIIVPTVCYIASATSSLVPSTTPSVIRLDVTVPPDTGRCLQLPATTTFSVAQKADKNTVVHVYINGALATSTHI